MKSVVLSDKGLKIEDIVEVAKNNAQASIDNSLKQKIIESQKITEKFVREQKVVYGITTGFGGFKNKMISKEQAKELQRNIILSHAAAVGAPFEEEIVRAMMLIRANSLAFGFSGVRFETVQTLIEMLNKGVTPVVPRKGSVGASGDLCHLSHMVLVMLGEGEAFYKGKKLSGEEAMHNARIPFTDLDYKEGLALTNGTAAMTAMAALTVNEAENLLMHAIISGALSLEALHGTTDAFDERIHFLRKHRGQEVVAKNVLEIVKDSEILSSKIGNNGVQDAYSLRCIPQVLGASMDAINYAKQVVEIEINSVTDNPLIFPDSETALSGGNFHGQPIALAMDFLAIALSEIASISERRIARLIDSATSNGLPAFLTWDGGLNSGFMIPQYTAASLVSENKILSHPASVDSIPTSANEEDHVSMGTIAARKASRVLKNAKYVTAIELLAAAQGLDFRKPLKAGIGSRAAFERIRSIIPMLERDRIMSKDIEKVFELIGSKCILKAVEEKTGKLC